MRPNSDDKIVQGVLQRSVSLKNTILSDVYCQNLC